MDLEVTETLNGGDLKKKGNDLALVYSFENMPYLALFGGNVEASTPLRRIASEQDFSWWGNSFMDTNVQFNSLTERTLHNTALTSSGRLVIEQAILKDLEFMKPFAEVTVSTAIVAPDHLRISVILREPGNLQQKEYIYIWDAANGAVLDINYQPNDTPASTDEALQYELQLYL